MCNSKKYVCHKHTKKCFRWFKVFYWNTYEPIKHSAGKVSHFSRSRIVFCGLICAWPQQQTSVMPLMYFHETYRIHYNYQLVFAKKSDIVFLLHKLNSLYWCCTQDWTQILIWCFCEKHFIMSFRGIIKRRFHETDGLVEVPPHLK